MSAIGDSVALELINNVVAPVRLALKSLYYRLESHEIRELSDIVQNLRPGRMFLEGPPFLTTCHLVQPEYFLVVRGGGIPPRKGDFFHITYYDKKIQKGSKHLFCIFRKF